jgi:hypothetical protein
MNEGAVNQPMETTRRSSKYTNSVTKKIPISNSRIPFQSRHDVGVLRSGLRPGLGASAQFSRLTLPMMETKNPFWLMKLVVTLALLGSLAAARAQDNYSPVVAKDLVGAKTE